MNNPNAQQIFYRMVAEYGIEPAIATEIFRGTRSGYRGLGASTAMDLKQQAIKQGKNNAKDSTANRDHRNPRLCGPSPLTKGKPGPAGKASALDAPQQST